MTNKFITGVAKAIGDYFGDSYNYYIDSVEQNLKTPCFTVGSINPTTRSTSAVRYHKSIPIVVQYFTDKDFALGGKTDCYEKAENLIEAIEYIRVETYLFRGERIEYQLLEDEEVLQFFITYDFDCTREMEKVLMEEGTYNGVPME